MNSVQGTTVDLSERRRSPLDAVTSVQGTTVDLSERRRSPLDAVNSVQGTTVDLSEHRPKFPLQFTGIRYIKNINIEVASLLSFPEVTKRGTRVSTRLHIFGRDSQSQFG